jgi:hypothetical protein
MLETWEAAVAWKSTSAKVLSDQPLVIAALLGWTRLKSDKPDQHKLNNTADACQAASKLLAGGHIERADLVGLSVRDAKEICERAQASIKDIEEFGT